MALAIISSGIGAIVTAVATCHYASITTKIFEASQDPSVTPTLDFVHLRPTDDAPPNSMLILIQLKNVTNMPAMQFEYHPAVLINGRAIPTVDSNPGKKLSVLPPQSTATWRGAVPPESYPAVINGAAYLEATIDCSYKGVAAKGYAAHYKYAFDHRINQFVAVEAELALPR